MSRGPLLRGCGAIAVAKGDHIRFKWTTGVGDVIFVPKGQATHSCAVHGNEMTGEIVVR
jgi:hypothetical protein